MNENAISFPNLGIHLSNVGKSITVFGFDIAYYGIIFGIAMAAGLLVAEAEAKRTKQNTEMYLDFAILAFIFSLIGARLYYVIFSWDAYKDNLLSIFNLRQGGLGFYGSAIGGALTLIVFCKVKKQNFWLMADTGCFGLITGQIIGRWGNFFNREAFGDYTNNLFAMRLPKSAVRPSDLTEKILAHMEEGCIQVHPTFLYESLWNLALLIFLLFYRKRKHFDGELLFIYLGGYGLGRFWIEGLRTDQLLLPGTMIAISQVLAGALFICSVWVITIVNYKKHKKAKQEKKAQLRNEE